MEAAEAYLRRLAEGVRPFNGGTIQIGTNKPWAWGLEFGRKRNGQLARRAGGTFALTSSFEAVKPRINPTIARTLDHDPAQAWGDLVGLAWEIHHGAVVKTPVVSGETRRSWQVIATKRPR